MGIEEQHVYLERVVFGGVVVAGFYFYCVPVAHSRYLVVSHYTLVLDLLKDFST